MDKLAPKLIRRAAKKDYVAVIIDPIYKVITGMKTSADQMANFATSLTGYMHRTRMRGNILPPSQQRQPGWEKVYGRASGSGVFARDPDALLDLIELETTDDLMKQEENKEICKAVRQWLDAHFVWQDDLSQDDLCSSRKMLDYCRRSWINGS